MKVKTFSFLVLGLLFLLPLAGRGEVVERIVALVNNEAITLSELEEMGKPVFEQVRQATTPAERAQKLKKARAELLEAMIESKLLEQEMKKKKIEVPERDVNGAIDDVLKNAKMSEADLKKTLAREGMTYSAYRQKVREELGKMRLVAREIKSKIVLEEEAVRRKYRQDIQQYTTPLEVKVQQIFFPLPSDPSPEEKAAARKEALSVLERARQGEDFTELAKKFSKGPEADEGGVLGFFKRQELMPELEAAGFSLKPGEISDLVESSAGIHILRVLERRGGEARPFAEVQFRIREDLMQAETEKKFNEWMKDLKSKAFIDIRL